MKNPTDILLQSYQLSRQQIDDAVDPMELLALFDKENVSCALIGGHMLSFYTGRARATVDVNFIISEVDFSRVNTMIARNYSQFVRHDRIYHVTYDSKKAGDKDAERIDLIKDVFPLFQEVVQHECSRLNINKDAIFRLPTIEAATALKFAASISPNRNDEDKSVDNADLLRLVRARKQLNAAKLMRLGDLIYHGGGQELVSIVKDIQGGKPISL